RRAFRGKWSSTAAVLSLASVEVSASTCVILKCTQQILSTNRTGFGMPNFVGVFSDRAIARETVGASHVDDRFVRPTVRICVKPSNPPLNLQIRFEVGQVHIVVTVMQKSIPDRPKNSRFIATKMVVKNKIEGFAGLRLIPVVPERIVPAAAAGHLLGRQTEEKEVFFPNLLTHLTHLPLPPTTL